ncbi:MAG: hypothetical protein JSS72_04395 [Armatimonadetes bacterium]|nr:hypothetical protein [Armatimonadota bacterium]
MKIFYNILLGAAVIIALMFVALVYFTGKGDAMSGGGAIRTTFKGKASIDDLISKVTLYTGLSFMGMMVVLDIVGNMIKD